jgi:DNA-directed RNA polymerase specialized sigma24 family protein
MDSKNDVEGLFGCAEQEHDEAAWAAIVEQYRRLMIAWAVRCPATATSGESPEAIADQALTRAWLAIAPKGFAAFPNLAALLAYMRVCVTHTAIDATRTRAAQARTTQWLAVHEGRDPEQTLLEQLDRTELWRLVNSLITTEQERVVLVERYVLDLPPRRILARHPGLFTDVTAIYSAVRNLCCRLERHRELRQLWDEYTAGSAGSAAAVSRQIGE